MQTYEEYYQYYLSELDKRMKPFDNTPAIIGLANAINNVVNIRMARYDYALQMRKYEEALAEERRRRNKHKHKHNIIFDIVKIAVLAVVAYVAPPLLAEAFPVLCEAGSFGSALGTGATIGLADAEMQGVGIAVGAQEKFSFNEVLESAVSGGVNVGASKLSTAVRAAVVGAAATGTQGIEMAFGMRDKFDPKSIGLQIASSVIAEGIKTAKPELVNALGDIGTEVTSMAVKEALNSIMQTVVTGQPIDVLNILTGITGNIVASKFIETCLPKLTEKQIKDEDHHEYENEKENELKAKDSKTKTCLDDIEEESEKDLKQSGLLDKRKLTFVKSNSTDDFVALMMEKGPAAAQQSIIENAKSKSVQEMIECASGGNKKLEAMLQSAKVDVLDLSIIPKICPWGINIENINAILDNYASYQARYTNFPSQLDLMAEYSRVTNLSRAERAEYDALLELGKKAYYHATLQSKKAQQQKAGLAEEILSQLNPALCPTDNPNVPTEKPKFTPINYDQVEDIINKPPQLPPRNPNVYDLTQKEMELYADFTGKFPGLGPLILHTLVKEATEIRRIAREVAYGDPENRDQAIGEGLQKAAGYYVGAKVFGPASVAVESKVGARLVSEAAAKVEAAEATGIQQVRKVANTKDMFEALEIKPGSGGTNVTEIIPAKGLQTSEMASARIATRAESEGGQVAIEKVKQPSGGGEGATKGLGANPFNGKTFEEIHEILTARGFRKVGPDPVTGKGSYFHPETGRKYYFDKGGVYKEGTELPHVDVHRMENGVNLEKVGKRRYPLGDKLIEENDIKKGLTKC